MPEYTLGPAIAAHAFDHRGMIQRVGINDQTWKELGQRAQRCVVGDIGAGEQQRGFFAVQVGQFFLKALVVDRGARNVARPARAGPGRIKRLVHGGKNNWVLPHPKIVVPAPDSDVFILPVRLRPDGVRKLPVAALNVDKSPVATFLVQPVNRHIKLFGIVHCALLLRRWRDQQRQPDHSPYSCLGMNTV